MQKNKPGDELLHVEEAADQGSLAWPGSTYDLALLMMAGVSGMKPMALQRCLLELLDRKEISQSVKMDTDWMFVTVEMVEQRVCELVYRYLDVYLDMSERRRLLGQYVWYEALQRSSTDLVYAAKAVELRKCIGKMLVQLALSTRSQLVARWLQAWPELCEGCVCSLARIFPLPPAAIPLLLDRKPSDVWLSFAIYPSWFYVVIWRVMLQDPAISEPELLLIEHVFGCKPDRFLNFSQQQESALIHALCLPVGFVNELNCWKDSWLKSCEPFDGTQIGLAVLYALDEWYALGESPVLFSAQKKTLETLSNLIVPSELLENIHSRIQALADR